MFLLHLQVNVNDHRGCIHPQEARFAENVSYKVYLLRKNDWGTRFKNEPKKSHSVEVV